MSTKGSLFSLPRHERESGVALVITLALLVLVAVAVVAFMARSNVNQQIVGGSSNGVVTQTFADGETQEIIGSLQKEMWDLSGYSQLNPAPTPAIFPIRPLPNPVTNRIQGIVPTIEVGPNVPTFPGDGTTVPDPNQPYSQFANLVKQSYTGVPTYTGVAGTTYTGGAGSYSSTAGPTVTGPVNASNVSTTKPSANGRSHDGPYWNQPQLTSVASTDTTDLSYLVPDWIYTSRNGGHPTTFASNQLTSSNGMLSSTSIIGRYAYNIYDVGGLLNANVAGYGAGVNTQPAYTNKDTMIVPGYKGSVLMADLSALNLNGNLNGSNATTFANPGAPNSLPNFRYSQGQQNWATDLPKLFASGTYGGWLQPFLPTLDPGSPTASPAATPSGAAPLTNSGFTSRQDLITWVTNQLSTSAAPATWALPYLTHFSYDIDAPSFAPNLVRPRSNVSLGTAGGNDSSAALDDNINPAFTAVLDANGFPLIKHRFPLSALSLLDNIYPGQVPADLLNPSSTLYKQIQYDFGLVWDSTYSCWDYKDLEGGSGAIKQLRTATNNGVNTVPNTRSPNFFELLKAAITAGSLGKEWGAGSFDGDPDNSLAPATNANTRYSATSYQIIQIGANIISQTTSNYCPTAICLNGNGQAPTIYGVKDLPYFYRTRLLTLTVDNFVNTASTYPMYDDVAKKSMSLVAVMVQPELWNPHAPNLLASTANYPKYFRIVPQTTTAIGVTTTSSGPGTQWQEGPDTTPGHSPIGDYTSMGGPYCLPNLNYHLGPPPDAYISFGWDAGHTDLLPQAPSPGSGSAIGSFREPCPLAAPTFPPNINLSSYPIYATMPVGNKVQWDKNPNTQISSNIPTSKQNVIPARFTATPSNTALGFLVAYCCTGSSDLTQIKGMTGGPMLLNLQYSMDSVNFYTYDTIQSSFPDNQSEAAPPSGVQQSYTGVRADPRTNRWGLLWANIPYGQYVYGSGTYINNTTYENQAGLTYSPSSNLGTTNYGTGGNRLDFPQAPGWLGFFKPTSPYAVQMAWAQVNQPNDPAYYQDPDDQVRMADGAYVNTSGMTGASGSAANAIGLPEAMLAETGNSQASAPGIANYDSRPIVLNRPFQSIAELGYAFRDTPWRSLDFFTPASGDNALLDVFSVYGPDPYSYMNTLTTETGLVAGKVNLNTRQQPVLAALLKGAATTTVFPTSTTTALTTLDDGQAAAIAQALVQWTTDTTGSIEGPLLNPAELVGKYTGPGATGYNGFSSKLTGLLTATEPPIIKQQRECVMHALADSGTTRTWNLLIDLVAQTGQLSQNAASATNPLQDFIVSGERHVWVSVALDRLTGRVIKMQVEPVEL